MWNKGTFSTGYTTNWMSPANWNGGVPANGSNVFMIFTPGGTSDNQVITNAASDNFIADSLTLTNNGTGLGNSITLRVSGRTFLTNGIGQLNIVGGNDVDTTLAVFFNSNVTFKTGAFIGRTGHSTLSFAGGAVQGENFVFTTTGAGNNRLFITNSIFGLTDTLTVTNLSSTAAGTLSANASVARLFINNAANNRFFIAGNTAVTGAVASVVGGFTLNNNGTITLSGGGGLIISNIAPTLNGTLNISDQTLNGNINWQNDGTVTLAGGFIIGNNLTNASGGDLIGFGTISNKIVNAGRIAATNGTLALIATPVVTGGGFDIANSGILTVATDWANSGTMSIAAGGALVGGSFTNTGGSGTLSGSGFVKTYLVNQGRMNFGGTVSNNFLQTAGSFTLSGHATITGSATLSGGTNNLLGNQLTTGLLVVNGTGILTNSISGGTVNGGISNANIVAVTADTYFNGPVTNTGAMFYRGAISNTLVNSGSVTLNNNATLTAAPRNTGTLDANGNTLTVTPAWANNGTIALGGGNLNGGDVTNQAGATLFEFGSVNADLINAGLVNATNGELRLIGAYAGAGAYRAVTGATLTFVGNGSISSLFNTNGTVRVEGLLTNTALFANRGTVTMAGGTYQSGGALSNTAVSAIIIGSGTIAAPVINLAGLVVSTNGELRLEGPVSGGATYRAGGPAGTLTFAGSGSISALFNTNSTVQVEGTLTNTAAFANQGTLAMAGGTYQSAVAITTASGRVIVGSGILNAPLSNSGTLTATNGTLMLLNAFTQNGTVNVASNGALSVQRDWANGNLVQMQGGYLLGGNLTNSASQDLTGFGTLSNKLVNAGLVTVSGGTLTLVNTPVVTGGGFSIAGSGVLEIEPDWSNGGTMAIAAGGAVTGGTFTNTSSSASAITGSGGFIKSFLVNQNRLDFNGITVSNDFLQTAGSFTIASGGATITGAAAINGGTLNFQGNRLTVDTLVIAAGATLTNSIANATVSGVITNAGTVNFAADGYVSGAVTNTGFWLQRGAISNAVANSGTLVLMAGTINPRVSGGLVNAASLIFSNGPGFVSGPVTNSGSISFQGAISNNYVQTAGTNILRGTGTITQTALISGGLFNLNGQTYSNGLMIVTGTGVLSNGIANATFNGGLSNANVVVTTANTFFKGTVTNTGAFFLQGTISNNLVNVGTMTLNADSVVTGSAILNDGSLNLNGMDLAGGRVVVGAGGVLTNSLAGGSVSAGLTNAGTVYSSVNTFFNGAVTNTGAFSWQGAISNNYVQTAGTNTLLGTATITQNSSVQGGVFDLNGKTYSNRLMIVGGTGVLTSSLANATFNGGLSNAATVYFGQSVTLNGPVTNLAAFAWQGTINNSYVQAAGTNRLTGTATITGNTTITGGLVDLNGNNGNFGSLTGSGTILNNGTGAGTLTIGANNGNDSYAGTITNGTGTLGLVKTGTGTLTMSGNSGYSGGTTISNGYLQVSNNNNALGSGIVQFAGTGLGLRLSNGVTLANDIIIGPNTGITGAGLIEVTRGTGTVSGAITINNNALNGGHFGASDQGANPTAVLNVDGVISAATTVVVREGSVVFSGGGTGYNNLKIKEDTTSIGANDGVATTAVLDVAGDNAAANFDLNGFNQSLAGLINTGPFASTVTNTGAASTLTLNVAAPNAYTFTGMIGGSLTLVKTGTGTQVLGGANNYTGLTVINAGRLGISHTNALLSSVVSNNVNGGVFFSNVTSFVFGGLAGAGNIGLTNTAGAAIALAVGRNNDDSTYSGILSGAGNLTKAGAGILTLAGNNTYSGATIISNGTIAISSAANLGGTSGITFNSSQNGTLYLTADGITLNKALTQNAPGNYQIDAGNTGTFGSSITGGGQFRKEGDGTIVLSSGYGASGKLVVNAGTVIFGASSYGSANMDVLAGTLNLGGNNLTVSTVLTLGTNSTAGTITGAGILTVNSLIDARRGTINANLAGTAALTKSTTELVTLSGTSSNTYSGLTTVSAGELDLNKSAGVDAITAGGLSISAGAIVKLLADYQINKNADITANGTLDLAGHNESFDSLNGSGRVDNSVGGANTLTVGTNNGNFTFSGVIQNTSGTLTFVKVGTGRGTLSGNNTYSGDTIINAGTLALGSSSTLPVGVGRGNVVVNGILDIVAFNPSINGLSGTGTVAMTLGGGGSTIRSIVTVGNNDANSTFTGKLTDVNATGGLLGLTKVGLGMLTLAGNSSYYGKTIVSNGVLRIASNTALGNTYYDGGVTVISGAALELSNNITVVDADGGAFGGSGEPGITLNGTGVSNGGALRNVSGNNTDAGSITLASASRINSDAGLLTLNGALNGASFALTVGGAGNTTIAGAIGTASLTKDGVGMLTLSGANTYNGDTTISAGTLKFGAANVIPDGSGKGNVIDNGTLDLGGFSETINGLSGTGTVNNTTGASTYTLTVGNNNATSIFAGTITNSSGTVALTKTGTGVFTLSGTNGYAGATTVSQGIVKLGSSGALPGSSVVTVSSGGTLDLNGQSATPRSVTVSSGGGLTNGIAGATLNSGLTNAGTVFVSQNTFFNGPVTNMSAMFFQGAISNALVNLGSFNLNGDGTLTVAPVNSGTLNAAASTLTVIPAWANAGSFQISGGVLAGGTMTNLANEGFLGYGTISNLVINNGTLTASGGTLTFAVAPVNNTTALVANASALNVLPAWTNAGVLSNSATGAVSGGTLTNTGTINGGGFYNAAVVNQNRLNFGGTISNTFRQTAGSFTLSGDATLTQTATLNGGTLNLQGNDLRVGLLVMDGTGVLTNNTAGATINGAVSNAATISVTANTFFNGAVTNTGSLFFQGAISNNLVNSGSVSLNNNSTITGTAIVNGGAFNLNGWTYSNGLMIVSGAGVLTNSVANATFNGGLSNAGTVFVGLDTFFKGPVTNTASFAWRGAISNNYVQSAGTNLLTGTATITGSATISGGMVDFNSKTGTVASLNGNGGTLLNNGNGKGVLIVTNGGAYGGTIADNTVGSGTMAVIVRGGVLTLSGNNTYSGVTTLTNSGATLKLGSATALGSIVGNTVVSNGAVLELNGQTIGTEQVELSGTGIASGGALVNSSGTAASLAGNVNDIASDNGIYSVGGTGDITLSGNVQGRLTKVGANTLTLAGTVDNSGLGVTVSNGVLVLAKDSNGGVHAIGGPGFTLAGGTIQLGGTGGDQIYDDSSQVVNGGVFDFNGNSETFRQVSGSGGTILNNGGAGSAMTIGYNNADGGNYSGTVANGSGGMALVKIGTGKQTLSGANTFTGLTTINAGQLIVGNLNAFQNSTVSNNSNGGVGFTVNTATFGGLAGTGNFGLTNGVNAVALTVGGNGDDTTYSGSLSGNGNFTKTGSGVLTFSGTTGNRYTGLTTVNAGELDLNKTVGINALNGNLTIAGGTVKLLADEQITNNAIVTVNGGSFNLNGAKETVGSVIIGSAGLLTNGVAGATLTGGLTNNGLVFLSADTFFNSVVTNTGTIFFQGAISNSLVNRGNFTLNDDGTLTVRPVNTGSINLGANTLTVSAVWSNAGTVSLAGGTLSGTILSNAGTMIGFGTVNPALTNSAGANVTATNGELRLAGNYSGAGVYRAASASTLTFAGNGSLSALFNTGATIRVEGLLTNTALFANRGTLLIAGGTYQSSSVISNASGFTVAGWGNVSAITNLAGGNVIATNGELRVTALARGAGAYRAVAGTSAATLTFAGGGTLSALFNTGGTIRVESLVTNTSLFVNQGTVTLAGGTYFSAANVTNAAGTVIESAANGTLAAAGIYNLGDIRVASGTTLILSNLVTQTGTIDMGGAGAVLNLRATALTNLAGGSITGGGVIQNGVQAFNLGSVLANHLAAELQFTNATTFGNAGTIGASAGATLTFGSAGVGSALITNFGTINLTGGTLRSGTLTNLVNGTLAGFGTLTGAVINAGTVAVTSGQTLTLAGATFSNAPTALIENPSGTIALTGATANFILTAGTSSNTFAFDSGTLLFSGATGTRTFTLAATNAGSAFSATNNNYFIGNLQLSGGSGNTLQLVGGSGRAVYVDNLILASGTTLDLAGSTLYYKTALNTTGAFLVNGNAIKLGSGGEFIFQPTSGTQSFELDGNWSFDLAPSMAGDQARIILPSATSVFITQNTALGVVTLADLVISNGGGGVSTLLAQRNMTMTNLLIASGGQLIVSNGVTITSPVLLNGGTLNNNGTVNGLLTIAGGTADGTYSNSGFIVINSGTLAGFVRNLAAGTISNFGTTATTGILTNAGTFVSFGGISNSVYNSAVLDLHNNDVRGLVINTSSLTVTDGLVNVTGGVSNAASGSIYLRDTGTLAGGVVTNLGTIAVVAGANVDADIVNAGGVIQATNGTVHLAGSLANAGSLNVSNSTVTITVAPINTGSINVAGALTVGDAWSNANYLSVAAAGSVSGGNLTNLASGTVTNAGYINSLVINQGRFVSSGTISNSFQQTSGTNFLSGDATITGTAQIAGGLFNLNGKTTSNRLLIVSGLGVASNGIAGATINGGVSNAATIVATATTFFNGVVTNTGSLIWQGAISNNLVNSGTILLSSDATVSGTTAMNAGTFNLAGRSFATPRMIVSGGAALTNAIAGAVFNGALTNAGTVGLTADTTFNGAITNTGTFRLFGTVSNTFANAGTLALNNNGTITGTLVNRGTTVVTNGTLTLLAAPTQSGTITVAAGRTLDVTPAWNNAGTVALNGGTVTGGTLTNTASGWVGGFGTEAGTIFNVGNIVVTNGTLTLLNAPTQIGTVTVSSAATLNVGADWRNDGLVRMTGGTWLGGMVTNAGSISGSGTIAAPVVNLNGATITAGSGGLLAMALNLIQQGNVEILGTLQVTPAWSNSAGGTVTLSGGVLTGGAFTVDGIVKGNGTISADMFVSNTKTVTVNGGQMYLTKTTTLAGGLIDGGPVENQGTITGFGTLSVALSNPGYVRATNGTLYIQTLTGNHATGTLEVSAGATLSANGITAWLNDGRVILAGGTVVGGNISNNAARLFGGYGTLNVDFVNSGTFQATSGQALTVNGATFVNAAGGTVMANSASLTVNGAFTNVGTFVMNNGIGRFNGIVVNQGAWITDPTTNIFNSTHTETSSGYISASAGDVFIFKSNLVNQSAQNVTWDTLNTTPGNSGATGTKFIFDGQGANLTQEFFTAGLALTGGFVGIPDPSDTGVQTVSTFSAVSGFITNFALDRLEIGNAGTNSILKLADSFPLDGQTAALFVNDLWLFGTSKLILNNDVRLYFVNSNNWSLSNIQLLGNAELHQLVLAQAQISSVIPEPSTLLLLYAGVLTAWGVRRRKLRSTRKKQ